MQSQLPADWAELLAEELEKPYFEKLQAFVEQERQANDVFPPADDVFNAFSFTSYKQTRVLLLGQDPYHGPGQAHGLCFSVLPGVKTPPSLVNVFKERKSDLGLDIPSHGDLSAWAKQGVLMLNTVLTVRAHSANSHRKQGWETFTDAVIRLVNDKADPVAFVLWGKPAQKKIPLIDQDKHQVIQAAHPSPLSAKSGFFGSKPFSTINQFLQESGQAEIDWSL